MDIAIAKTMQERTKMPSGTNSAICVGDGREGVRSGQILDGDGSLSRWAEGNS